MKIGIYSDIHASRNDKVFSQTNSHNIYDSMLWARQTFKDKGCDLIIDGGDFLDSDSIDAETNDLIYKIYKNNVQKELILLGNHEKKDAEGKYTSLNILDNYPNIEIIRELKAIDIDNNTVLIFQPYMRSDWKELCALLDKNQGKKRILFSHLTYDNLPNIKMMAKGEIDYLLLKNRVEQIFNGHIHIGLETEKYCQIGQLTGLSFSDEYSFYNPGIIIYDTETNKIERIENPKAILYQKLKYTDIDNIKNIERSHLRIDCPPTKADELNQKLENTNCLSFRLKMIIDENKTNKEDSSNKVDFNLYTSPAQALLDFFKTEKTIFTEDQINTYLEEYIKEK